MKKFGLKSIALAILIISVLALPCFAAETSNKTQLAIENSSVNSNDVNVFLNSVCELEFSDNIADRSVAKTNSSCFHLSDDQNNVVEISIIFPDDQINDEYKNMAFVRPTSPLKPNTKYTLTIDAGLKTKYNNELNKAQQIVFTTGKDSTTEQNQNLTALGDNVITYTCKIPLTKERKTETKSESKTETKAEAKQANKTTDSIDGDNNNTAILIVIVILIVIAFFYFLFTKNKKNEVINTPKEQNADELMADESDKKDDGDNDKKDK